MMMIMMMMTQRGLDLLSDKRELLTGERAAELMGGAPEDATAVRLGSKSFGQDAAEEAAKVLRRLQNVEWADMSDIIAGRPEAEALEVLKCMCGALPAAKLKAIDLSENALGEKGIRALEPVLRSLEALEEIKFMNDGLSELSVRLLAEYLPVEHLRTLHFHNNMSGSGGAVAAAAIVAKCDKLEDFRMSSSRVQPDGGLELIKALSSKGATLRKLNLSDSMLDEECTEELVAGLQKFTKLTDLILRDTGVDKDAIIEVLSDPSVVPELAVLDLSGLELEADDAEAVGKLLVARPRLRKVWLDDNELESDGLVKFCLAATDRSAPSMIELVSAQSSQVGQRGAIALIKFALAHKSVKRVELNDNQIAEAAVEKIQSMLEKAGRADILGNLDENADDMDEDEDEDFEEADEGDDELAALTKSLESNLSL